KVLEITILEIYAGHQTSHTTVETSKRPEANPENYQLSTINSFDHGQFLIPHIIPRFGTQYIYAGGQVIDRHDSTPGIGFQFVRVVLLSCHVQDHQSDRRIGSRP